MSTTIINTHVQDVTNIPQAPSLWDVANYLYSQGESSMYVALKEFIHEHDRTKTKCKNLEAWHTVAEREVNINESIG